MNDEAITKALDTVAGLHFQRADLSATLAFVQGEPAKLAPWWKCAYYAIRGRIHRGRTYVALLIAPWLVESEW